MIKNINSLSAHQKLMDINANNVANVNTNDYKAINAHITDKLEISSHISENGTDLTKEIANQIEIKNGFKAQIPVIKTEDEMTKTILDIKA